MRYFSDAQSKSRLRGYDFLSSQTQAPVPKHLFHYTNNHGFVGIVSSKAVWLSDAQLLNDDKELLYFKEIVKQAAHNMGNNNDSAAMSSNEKDFVSVLEHYAMAITSGIFVTSFSEHRDQLSQWRAYTDDSRGVSVGFPAQPLKAIADRSGFFLVKCCYDRKQAYRAAWELLLHFRRWQVSEPSLDVDTLKHEFARQTMLIAPLFKHPAFSEEAEWRLFDLASWQEGRLQFRPSKDSIVPYLSFDLSGIVKPGFDNIDDNFLLIPGPGHRYNPTSGQGIFWKYFGKSPTVGKSEVPYRTS